MESEEHRESNCLIEKLEEAQRPEERAELLIAEFEKLLSSCHLWKCRRYVWTMADTEFATEPHILTLRIMLAVLSGKSGKAEKLCQQLPKNSAYFDLAEIFIPNTPLGRFQEALSDLKKNHETIPLPSMMHTMRLSVINNVRDLTPDWETLMKTPDETEAMFCALYGDEGHYAFLIAQAEWLYQKGENLQALMLAMGVIPLLRRQEHDQMLFTAMHLESYIMLMEGQLPSAAPLLTALRKLIPEVTQEDSAACLEAIEVQLSLYEGDCQRATKWLNGAAPNEYEGYCAIDTYQYILKLRIYLLQKKFLAFQSLASQMLYHAQLNKREQEKCQILLLWALCDQDCGNEASAYSHLTEGLKLAEKYQYNRLVADEGMKMLQLLQSYREHVKKYPYLERLIVTTRKTAALYPCYLRREDPEKGKLSPKEVEVLRFLSDGRKNAEIAQLMDVKIDTVKAHCKHINQKLKTENRQQAVRRAMELGILKQIGVE